MELFVECGLDNVIMWQIVVGVGVSLMMLYCYFQDKDEIFVIVCVVVLDCFVVVLEVGLVQGSDVCECVCVIGDVYVCFVIEYLVVYQLMLEIFQVDESCYLELVCVSCCVREIMVGYVCDMICEGMMDGDVDLIGYMFWFILYGIVVLDMVG